MLKLSGDAARSAFIFVAPTRGVTDQALVAISQSIRMTEKPLRFELDPRETPARKPSPYFAFNCAALVPRAAIKPQNQTILLSSY
jgi:hypothetical protein